MSTPTAPTAHPIFRPTAGGPVLTICSICDREIAAWPLPAVCPCCASPLDRLAPVRAAAEGAEQPRPSTPGGGAPDRAPNPPADGDTSEAIRPVGPDEPAPRPPAGPPIDIPDPRVRHQPRDRRRARRRPA